MSDSRLPTIWSELHEGDYCTYRMDHIGDVDACVYEILKTIDERDRKIDELQQKIVDLEDDIIAEAKQTHTTIKILKKQNRVTNKRGKTTMSGNRWTVHDNYADQNVNKHRVVLAFGPSARFEMVCDAEPGAECQQADDRRCSIVADFPEGYELLDFGEGQISFPVSAWDYAYRDGSAETRWSPEIASDEDRVQTVGYAPVVGDLVRYCRTGCFAAYGIVSSASSRFVFVRYVGDPNAKATLPEDLELVLGGFALGRAAELAAQLMPSADGSGAR